MSNKSVDDILGFLNQISESYMKLGNTIKANSFSKASNNIKDSNIQIINSSADVKGISGVGPSTMKEIDQFIQTGTSDRYESIKNELSSIVSNSENAKSALDKFKAIREYRK